MSDTHRDNDEFIESIRDELSAAPTADAEDRAHEVLKNFRGRLEEHPYVRSLEGSGKSSSPRRQSWVLKGWCATGALALLASLAIVLWPTRDTLAQTHEAIRNATSMICDIKIFNEGEPQITHKFRWVAPDRIRVDFGGPGQFMHETRWIEGTRTTVWDHQGNRAYIVENMPKFGTPWMQFVEIHSTAEGIIRALEGEWTDVGEVEVNGRTFAKYEMRKSEGAPLTGLLVDPETRLPYEIGSSSGRREDGKIVSWISFNQHFTWNEAIPDSIMLPDLPEGLNPRTIDGSKGAIPHTILAGVGVGPIRLGMSHEEVAELWGEPDEDLGDGYLNYFEHGVQLMIWPTPGLRIISCVTAGKIMGAFKTYSGTTPEGIGIGATEREIFHAYGKPDERVEKPLSLIYNTGISFYLYADPKSYPDDEPRVQTMFVRAPQK